MKPQFLQGWITYISLAALLVCYAAKKYLGLPVPEEVVVTLVGSVIFGLKRGQNRIEATINDAVDAETADQLKQLHPPQTNIGPRPL